MTPSSIPFRGDVDLVHNRVLSINGVLLVRTASGAPTTGAHKMPCLAIDAAGSLFILTANGTPGTWSAVTIGKTLTASLGGDVGLNNTGSYFDGPSVAQGTTGTWFVSAVVTVLDTASAALFNGKLWDGTTVIASGRTQSAGATSQVTLPLLGTITSPAGNLRISIQDITATTGAIKANSSGNAKDSTITAVKIV